MASPSKNTERVFRLELCSGSGTRITYQEIAPFCAHLEVPRSPFFRSGGILEFGRVEGSETLKHKDCASVTQSSVVQVQHTFSMPSVQRATKFYDYSLLALKLSGTSGQTGFSPPGASRRSSAL